MIFLIGFGVNFLIFIVFGLGNKLFIFGKCFKFCCLKIDGFVEVIFIKF